mmetsp:Transcript_79527/g.233800  ORF Transcript_79527/g.233800 Transcript_79527/m.233800 type:complete len:228 (+) Transcript_79527:638-1321(+)
MCEVHLRDLVPCLRQPQEEPRRGLLQPLPLPGVRLLQLPRGPAAALADALQQLYRDLAVPHGAHAVEVHDRQSVSRWSVAAVQGLRVPQRRPLEGLLRAGAREVERGEVEHPVRAAPIGRGVEVVEGEFQVALLHSSALEVDVAKPIVTQGVVLRGRGREVGERHVQVLGDPQAQAVHVAQKAHGPAVVLVRGLLQVVCRSLVVLAEPLDAQQVPLAHGRRDTRVPA